MMGIAVGRKNYLSKKGHRVLSAPRFLDRFRRVTSSGGFIAEIDGLRLIAIGAVILFHLAVNLSGKAPQLYGLDGSRHWLTLITHYGSRGVELFFVISGFTLALPFASHFLLAGGENKSWCGQSRAEIFYGSAKRFCAYTIRNDLGENSLGRKR